MRPTLILATILAGCGGAKKRAPEAAFQQLQDYVNSGEKRGQPNIELIVQWPLPVNDLRDYADGKGFADSIPESEAKSRTLPSFDKHQFGETEKQTVEGGGSVDSIGGFPINATVKGEDTTQVEVSVEISEARTERLSGLHRSLALPSRCALCREGVQVVTHAVYGKLALKAKVRGSGDATIEVNFPEGSNMAAKTQTVGKSSVTIPLTSKAVILALGWRSGTAVLGQMCPEKNVCQAELRRTPAKAERHTLSCRTAVSHKGNGKGKGSCSGYTQCKNNQVVTAASIACGLEWPLHESQELNRRLDNTKNQIFRHKRATEGTATKSECKFGATKITGGGRDITGELGKSGRITFSCSDKDKKSVGECSMKGWYTCGDR